jgi:hypothetical protein
MLAIFCTSCRWQIAKQFITFTSFTEVWLVGGNKKLCIGNYFTGEVGSEHVC